MLRLLRVEVRSAIEGPVFGALRNQMPYLSEQCEQATVLYNQHCASATSDVKVDGGWGCWRLRVVRIGFVLVHSIT